LVIGFFASVFRLFAFRRLRVLRAPGGLLKLKINLIPASPTRGGGS
jgi:hypothetical protein